MTDSLTRQLVDGVESIGRSLYLQVFTAPNGIALLDWVPQEHRVLTLWVHGEGADLRIGTSVHTVIPLTDADQVDELVAVLRSALTQGSWHERFLLDPRSGVVEPQSWQLSHGWRSGPSGPRPARDPAGQVQVRRRGSRWGPEAEGPVVPPDDPAHGLGR